MNYCKDIWQLIAEQIDDSKTFMTFSMVCKLFADVSKILNHQKKIQYSKSLYNQYISGCPCCDIDIEEGFKLPNGNWHGKYIHIFPDITIVKYYDNGIELLRET